MLLNISKRLTENLLLPGAGPDPASPGRGWDQGHPTLVGAGGGGEGSFGTASIGAKEPFPLSVTHRAEGPRPALGHSSGAGTCVPRGRGDSPALGHPVPPSALFVFSAHPAVITTRCHSPDNTSFLLSLLN